jgi:hypothetical protein
MTNTKNELRQEAATEISYILSALGLQDWADGSQALFQALQGTRKADISAVIETLRTIKTAVRVDREALKVYDCAEAARALAKVDRDTAAGCQCGEAYGRRAPLVALCGYCRHGRQTRLARKVDADDKQRIRDRQRSQARARAFHHDPRFCQCDVCAEARGD